MQPKHQWLLKKVIMSLQYPQHRNSLRCTHFQCLFASNPEALLIIHECCGDHEARLDWQDSKVNKKKYWKRRKFLKDVKRCAKRFIFSKESKTFLWHFYLINILREVCHSEIPRLTPSKCKHGRGTIFHSILLYFSKSGKELFRDTDTDKWLHY